MKKITLALLLFLSPTLAYAGEQVVLLKKDCYALKNRIVCEGTVKNIGDTDVKDVIVLLSAPLFNLGGLDKIEYLPAKEKVDFKIMTWGHDNSAVILFLLQYNADHPQPAWLAGGSRATPESIRNSDHSAFVNEYLREVIENGTLSSQLIYKPVN